MTWLLMTLATRVSPYQTTRFHSSSGLARRILATTLDTLCGHGTTIISSAVTEDILEKNNGSGDMALEGVVITLRGRDSRVNVVLRTIVTNSLGF